MTAGSAAFGIVSDELDEAIRGIAPLDGDPSWLVTCNGEVFRITLARRRPNGTAWFEATSAHVPGFEYDPTRVPETLELRRRAAVDLARAERLRADAALAFLGGLSAAQLEGLACAWCHKPAVNAAMVPLKVITGLEYTGAHHTLFVCDPDCREAP